MDVPSPRGNAHTRDNRDLNIPPIPSPAAVVVISYGINRNRVDVPINVDSSRGFVELQVGRDVIGTDKRLYIFIANIL